MFATLIWGLYLLVVVFVLVMLYRLVIAIEKISDSVEHYRLNRANETKDDNF